MPLFNPTYIFYIVSDARVRLATALRSRNSSPSASEGHHWSAIGVFTHNTLNITFLTQMVGMPLVEEVDHTLEREGTHAKLALEHWTEPWRGTTITQRALPLLPLGRDDVGS